MNFDSQMNKFVSAETFAWFTGYSCHIGRIHSEFWNSSWCVYAPYHGTRHLFHFKAVSVFNRFIIIADSTNHFHCFDFGKFQHFCTPPITTELHFNRLFFVVVSDNFAIFIWNENGRLFKSTGFQCVFSNWRNLPEHLRCSEFRIYAYHTILCEKLLISQ